MLCETLWEILWEILWDTLWDTLCKMLCEMLFKMDDGFTYGVVRIVDDGLIVVRNTV